MSDRIQREWNHTKLLSIFTGLLVLIGAVYSITTIFQWRSMEKQTRAMTEQLEMMKSEAESIRTSRSADYILRFDDQFAREPFHTLKSVIENNRRILKPHGGKFSEDDLEGYLNLFEGLSGVYHKGLIQKDLLYSCYSYDIEKAYDNPEVQGYLKDARKTDPLFYTGFESLAKSMKEMDSSPPRYPKPDP